MKKNKCILCLKNITDEYENPYGCDSLRQNLGLAQQELKICLNCHIWIHPEFNSDVTATTKIKSELSLFK
jgi:hypothetical protein